MASLLSLSTVLVLITWSSLISSIFSSSFTSSSFTIFGGVNFTWLISGGGGAFGGGGGGGGGGGSFVLTSAICVSNTSISSFEFLSIIFDNTVPKNPNKTKARVIIIDLVKRLL